MGEEEVEERGGGGGRGERRRGKGENFVRVILFELLNVDSVLISDVHSDHYYYYYYY